jgi:hypothetical protein
VLTYNIFQLEKWFASLLIELAPTPIQEDLQKACERLSPAFRSMANAFCETQSVGKISGHQEYSRTGGRAGTIERYYSVTDNGLLRYPGADQPCIVVSQTPWLQHGLVLTAMASPRLMASQSRASNLSSIGQNSRGAPSKSQWVGPEPRVQYDT